MPGNHSHPGVQHAYFLTQNIHEPTLIIAKRDLSRKGYPLPDHATLKEISYNDFALTGASSGKTVLNNEGKELNQKFRFVMRLLIKLREVLFLVKAVPVLIKFRPRVLHSHGLATLSHGLFAKLFLRSRFVITIHSNAETLLVRRLSLLRCALKYCDKIVCVSEAVRRNLSDLFPRDKLEVIPTGFDPRIFENLQLERKNQIVAVGYLKWQKDYPCMIKAAAQLFSKFGDYRLVIIGDGPERATIEKEIADLGMDSQIHLLGNLSQQEIVKHLNESKLFVMSSLSEGLPKALLEACACGTPAVVTTACNAEGIIEEVGIAVTPGESQALAEAVETILTDDHQWSRLSENSLRVAERYRWDSISNEMLGLYQRL